MLARSPAQPLFRWRAMRRLAVLAYHGVDDPECFARQMDYLLEATRPVGVSELLTALADRRSLPDRAVLVTFDDGHRSVLEAGMPILRERGIPAVVFVVAGVLDSSSYIWPDEVTALLANGGKTAAFSRDLPPRDLIRALKRSPDELRLAVLDDLRRTARQPPAPRPQLRRDELPLLESAGIEIGNHTLTHPCLPRCEPGKVSEELTSAHEVLRRALGRAPRTFAYPNGDDDQRAYATLANLGYGAAFLFDHRVGPWLPPERYRISRIRVNSDTHMDRFRIILSGLHCTLHRLRGGS